MLNKLKCCFVSYASKAHSFIVTLIGAGRPRTPELRSRRYHTPTHQTVTHQPIGVSVVPSSRGRQGPSFEDGDGVSADLKTMRQPSPCRVRSVGVNHQSPVPSVLPTKPPVPSIPKNSTRERYVEL